MTINAYEFRAFGQQAKIQSETLGHFTDLDHRSLYRLLTEFESVQYIPHYLLQF